jgi:hypothetical protein
MKAIVIIVLLCCAVSAQAGWLAKGSEFGLSYAAIAIAHTGGHFQQADALGIPISLDARNLVEVYHPRTTEQRALMAGAGYQAQDFLARASVGESFGRSMRWANALYKALYLGNVPSKLSSRMVPAGDLGEMDRSLGRHYGREILASTMVADLVGLPLFYDQSPHGTPMVMLAMRF